MTNEGLRSPTLIRGERRPLWTLTVGCFGVALVVGSMVAFNSALADIAVSTSATHTQVNWIVDGYTMALAGLLLPAGAIGDRYGRRGAMLAGLAVFSVASLAPAFLDDPFPITVARIVAGAGAAFVMPATLSLVSLAYPSDSRSKVVGVWAGVAGCAGVVGLLGSGVLLLFSDWRAICWALSAAGVVVFCAGWTLPRSRDADARPVDWIGAVLIGGAVAVTVFGLLEAPSRGWADPLTLGCLTAGALAVGVFAAVEKRRRWPLVDPQIFGNAQLSSGAATVSVVFLATFGFFYLGMQYAQLILNYSTLGAAVAFAPFMVPVVGLSAVAFWIAPRCGMRLLQVTGLVLISCGFLGMTRLAPDSSYVDLLLPTVVIATGIGICTAPSTSAIMDAVQDERQGFASAINDTARELGAAVGIAVAGSVVAHGYTGQITPRLAEVPQAARQPVASSLGQALHVAESMGPYGVSVAQMAQEAFVSALHTSAVVVAVLTALAAAVIGTQAPGRVH